MSPRRPIPATSPRKSTRIRTPLRLARRRTAASVASIESSVRPPSRSITSMVSTAPAASGTRLGASSVSPLARTAPLSGTAAFTAFTTARTSATTRALGDRALRVGKQHELAGGLDRQCDPPLVLCAVPGNPPRPDLAPVTHVLPEHRHVLVVDPHDVVPTKGARLLLDPSTDILRRPAGASCCANCLAPCQNGSSSGA